ncbi:MAG: response regulator transcription factor [Bryobacteraceae bacterium]|nr:response regulator transcription factor [Bryobacteraceae bacterium]
MRVLIVDDEPIARKVLREELELVPDVEIVGEADDGDKALSQILACHPDLVFLDLQMPAKGGFEVIQELRSGPLPSIVIVTAFDEYALRAFEAGAVDYLLKPISHERLQLSLQRVRQFSGKPKDVAEQVAQLQEIADGARPSAPVPRRIVGRNGDEYILLNTNEVLAFQADGDLVWIVTLKHKLLATQTLRELQTRLEGLNFQRVHRNSLVNVNHVRKMSPLSSQRWLLTLNNNQEIIVSKRQVKTVRDLLSW